MDFEYSVFKRGKSMIARIWHGKTKASKQMISYSHERTGVRFETFGPHGRRSVVPLN
jgi:hypothetical protein